jgi:hypothetical protein
MAVLSRVCIAVERKAAILFNFSTYSSSKGFSLRGISTWKCSG